MTRPFFGHIRLGSIVGARFRPDTAARQSEARAGELAHRLAHLAKIFFYNKGANLWLTIIVAERDTAACHGAAASYPIPGAAYHVMNRGSSRQKAFSKTETTKFFSPRLVDFMIGGAWKYSPIARFGTGSYGTVGWTCHGVAAGMNSDGKVSQSRRQYPKALSTKRLDPALQRFSRSSACELSAKDLTRF